MNTKISDLRAVVIAKLDSAASIVGENTTLTQSQQDDISKSIDDSNETWNPNLPPRPANP